MKDFIKKHRRNLLITFAWILVLVGMFVRKPIEGGIVFGALLIVISLLIAGYNKKIWDNLGTGLTYLEDHYGQMQTKVMRDSLTKGIEDDVKYLLEE